MVQKRTEFLGASDETNVGRTVRERGVEAKLMPFWGGGNRLLTDARGSPRPCLFAVIIPPPSDASSPPKRVKK